MDRSRPDSAPTALASAPAGQVVASGGLVCADDLPDGLVVADHLGRIVVFNHAASRLTGIATLNALGRDVRQVLPMRDSEGRGWSPLPTRLQLPQPRLAEQITAQITSRRIEPSRSGQPRPLVRARRKVKAAEGDASSSASVAPRSGLLAGPILVSLADP